MISETQKVNHPLKALRIKVKRLYKNKQMIKVIASYLIMIKIINQNV